jgi:hypothetical protein
MSVIHCDRCGTHFSTDDRFMTVDIEAVSGRTREVIDQVLLCDACTRSVGTDLSLETTTHQRTGDQ